ncbi:hypothetical protein KDL44_06520 [bacterium]|nr:hypothetical protein [bacterium]
MNLTRYLLTSSLAIAVILYCNDVIVGNGRYSPPGGNDPIGASLIIPTPAESSTHEHVVIAGGGTVTGNPSRTAGSKGVNEGVGITTGDWVGNG